MTTPRSHDNPAGAAARAAAATRLKPCDNDRHCVCSRQSGGRARAQPIGFTGTAEAARQRLLAVLAGMPRTRVVTAEPTYIHAECRSLVFRFVDDLELEIDPRAAEIHLRSESRFANYDFQVNRKRVEAVRQAFLAAGDPAGD